MNVPGPETIFPTHTTRGVTEIAGASVRYTLEIPDDILDPVPSVITNGYCGTKGAYHAMRQTFAAAGKPAVTYHSPRAQKLTSRLSPDHLLHVDKLQAQAAWAVMRSLGYDVYDMVGHSMGGATAAAVASHKPAHVRSALFIASAGLDVAPGQHHGVAEMLVRGARFFPRELLPSLTKLAPEKRLTVARQAGYYVLRDVTRTVQEGMTVAVCNIGESVRQLSDQGIKTGGLFFEDDTFFRTEDVLRHSGDAFDILEIYPERRANHIAPQLYPREIALAGLSILGRLNQPIPAVA